MKWIVPCLLLHVAPASAALPEGVNEPFTITQPSPEMVELKFVRVPWKSIVVYASSELTQGYRSFHIVPGIESPDSGEFILGVPVCQCTGQQFFLARRVMMGPQINP